MSRLLAEVVFEKINIFIGFGSKDLSNAKEDMTKDAAMDHGQRPSIGMPQTYYVPELS